MSLWTKFRDTWEKAATFGAYDPKKSRQADREQQNMINEQMKAYKDQTELTKQQLNEARDATNAEKRRVEEKQIRSLRRNYRSQGAGMLGVGTQDTSDVNQQLGG